MSPIRRADKEVLSVCIKLIHLTSEYLIDELGCSLKYEITYGLILENV